MAAVGQYCDTLSGASRAVPLHDGLVAGSRSTCKADDHVHNYVIDVHVANLAAHVISVP